MADLQEQIQVSEELKARIVTKARADYAGSIAGHTLEQKAGHKARQEQFRTDPAHHAEVMELKQGRWTSCKADADGLLDLGKF